MPDRKDPGKGNRTFRTRLEFIDSVFAEPHDKADILARCVQFRLSKSLEEYEQELNRCLDSLECRDEISVLNKIK